MNATNEATVKRERVQAYMEKKGLDAVVLGRQDNFAWYTCGGDNHVVTASEAGAAALVILRERVCAVTDNIEAPRLAAEELPPDIEVLHHPWHDDARTDLVRRLVARGRAASDDGTAGLPLLDADFAELRWSLTPEEVARYRALGRDCSQAMTTVCRAIEPGWTELDVAGRLAAELLPLKITPYVTLVGADDRIVKFRHPICTPKPIERCAMVVLCGRRHGLICSLTRLVHFGRLPDELAARHRAVCAVDAAFILETRIGATAGAIFRAAMSVYAAHGLPEEWRLHHQGGATGYAGRDYKATPDDPRRVEPNQAFAWNPSITGTKSEDTILALQGGPEVLSPPTDWPTLTASYKGETIERADILAL